MDIKWLETQLTDTELAEIAGERWGKLIIQVNRETEIVVLGYGSGRAKMYVQSMPSAPEGYDPTGLVGQNVWDTIARAIVWASPTTIAHLVMETIHDQ